MVVILITMSLVIVCSLLWVFCRREKNEAEPWGFPMLGHLPALGSNPAETLVKWKQPIVFLRFGNIPTAVISNGTYLKEIMSLPEAAGCYQLHFTKSVNFNIGIFNCDPPMVFEQRQFALRTLKDFGYRSSRMEVKIQDEIHLYLNRLQSEMKGGGEFIFEPKHFFNIYVLNSIWEIIMGSRFESKEDSSDVMELLQLMDNLKKLETNLAKLCVFLPWLDDFCTWCGLIENKTVMKKIYDYFAVKIVQRKKNWIPGQPRDFMEAYLDKVNETTRLDSSFHSTKNFQPYTTSDLFMASIETSASILEWFLLYMASDLDIQRKFQDEIDAQIPSSRLPLLTDRPNMPYAEAVITELFRITTIIPFGIPHKAMADFTYRGHTIKRGTMLLSNLYGINHDPVNWPQPNQFRPDRFFKDGKFQKPLENFCPFGAGRRMCLGESLGRDIVFLNCTSFLQKFRVLPPTQKWNPPLEFNFGFAVSPNPFQVLLKERLH